MSWRTLFIAAVFLAFGQTVLAQDVAGLADCTTRVFRDLGRSGRWSGKPPSGCTAKVALEKRTGGYFVTAWKIENAEGGWVRTSFSGAMGFREISGKTRLAKACRDIIARAARLERCLKSINSVNDPLECRDRATKSYLAGEESGTANTRLVWLDDDGRHTVVEYAFGTASSTPTPPVDLFQGELLPAGVLLDLHLRDDR